jgi:hypothetical protein
VLGDKAYSNKAIRSHLRHRGIKTTIPERADQQANRARLGNKGGRPPKWRASHIPDSGPYKVRPGMEDATC